MKTCPRCGAIAFDDAEVCYGCLYQFASPEQIEENVQSVAPLGNGYSPEVPMSAFLSESEAVEKRVPLMPDRAPVDREPPEFCIHLTPRHNAWGGWRWDCSVEIAEKIRHEVVGRHAVKVRS